MIKRPEALIFPPLPIEPEIIKTGKINEVLNGKPNILVQILKEPIANQRPAPELRAFAARPFCGAYTVQRCCSRIAQNSFFGRTEAPATHCRIHQAKNFGVIVRTAAEGKNTAELHEDLSELFATCGIYSEKPERRRAAAAKF
jgi:ribonuclease G